jgi:hypothetical protein
VIAIGALLIAVSATTGGTKMVDGASMPNATVWLLIPGETFGALGIFGVCGLALMALLRWSDDRKPALASLFHAYPLPGVARGR